jgi:hypothetical protein
MGNTRQFGETAAVPALLTGSSMYGRRRSNGIFQKLFDGRPIQKVIFIKQNQSSSGINHLLSPSLAAALTPSALVGGPGSRAFGSTSAPRIRFPYLTTPHLHHPLQPPPLIFPLQVAAPPNTHFLPIPRYQCVLVLDTSLRNCNVRGGGFLGWT